MRSRHPLPGGHVGGGAEVVYSCVRSVSFSSGNRSQYARRYPAGLPLRADRSMSFLACQSAAASDPVLGDPRLVALLRSCGSGNGSRRVVMLAARV